MLLTVLEVEEDVLGYQDEAVALADARFLVKDDVCADYAAKFTEVVAKFAVRHGPRQVGDKELLQTGTSGHSCKEKKGHKKKDYTKVNQKQEKRQLKRYIEEHAHTHGL